LFLFQAHEIVALEILTLLLETPTDDSVEVAIAFLKECGMKLMEVSNKGMLAIFETLRNILHEGHLDKRVSSIKDVRYADIKVFSERSVGCVVEIFQPVQLLYCEPRQ
jgi:hypothetical protein